MPTLKDEFDEAWDASLKAIKAQNDAWIARWPSYCRDCGGWGAHTWRESHGLAYGSETLSEPCDKCTAVMESGPQKCPRCAAWELNEDGTGPCRSCGWNYDDGLMDF